jgi:hypothetical protein
MTSHASSLPDSLFSESTTKRPYFIRLSDERKHLNGTESLHEPKTDEDFTEPK